MDVDKGLEDELLRIKNSAEQKALNERLEAKRQKKATERMGEQQANVLEIIPEDKSEDGDIDTQKLSDLEKELGSTDFSSEEDPLSEQRS